MRLLLDTHFAFWLALDPSQLSAKEQTILMDPDNAVFASAISLWELRIKWDRRFASGERKGPADPAKVLKLLTEMQIPVAALTPEQAASALRVELPHRDPFDEQLLIHAQEMDLLLLTRDEKLAGHPSSFVPA